VSAVQAAAFNRVLEQRMRAGTLGTLLEGDLAWKHDKGAVFRVTPDELASGALQPRLEALEISPSGPVWGRGMTRASGAVDALEEAALNEFGVTFEEIASNDSADEGARRPLRIPLKLPELDAGVDEHGGYIRLAFELPPGAYATIVTREIMKNAHDDEEAE
jgi:tRNA pseudouridine13 synthase